MALTHGGAMRQREPSRFSDVWQSGSGVTRLLAGTQYQTAHWLLMPNSAGRYGTEGSRPNIPGRPSAIGGADDRNVQVDIHRTAGSPAERDKYLAWFGRHKS
jgi:hypothetical protein